MIGFKVLQIGGGKIKIEIEKLFEEFKTVYVSI